MYPGVLRAHSKSLVTAKTEYSAGGKLDVFTSELGETCSVALVTTFWQELGPYVSAFCVDFYCTTKVYNSSYI